LDFNKKEFRDSIRNQIQLERDLQLDQ